MKRSLLVGCAAFALIAAAPATAQVIFSEDFSSVVSDPLGPADTSERWASTFYGADPVDVANRWQFFENTYLALNRVTQDKAILLNEEAGPANGGVAIKTPGIPVVAGQQYTLSFEHSGDNNPGTYSFRVEIDSILLSVVTRPFLATGTGAFMTTVLPFIAPDNEIVLAFTDQTLASASSGIIDNIRIMSVIPEPEIYGMLLAGFGLLGFIVRRRTRRL